MISPLRVLQRLPFFIAKLRRDLMNPLRYVCNIDDVHETHLGKYYLVFDEAELMQGGSQDFHFDDEGIPVIPTYIDVEPRRMHYYPISIGQYALAIFHTWLRTAQDEDRRRFLHLADWFVEHQADDGCWNASVEVPMYRLPAPWPSAMAQGRALSVLLRAWQCTSEEKYLASARRGLAAFSVPIEQGGVLGTCDGRRTFEEYPSRPAPHVLNGMIFALFGLWDMVRAQPDDSKAAEIFEQGVATVAALLPRYDTGWWSIYDLYHLEVPSPRNLTTVHYHDIHIKQLTVMHAITGLDQFAEFARRWAAYEVGWSRRLRAYAGKAVLVARRKLK